MLDIFLLILLNLNEFFSFINSTHLHVTQNSRARPHSSFFLIFYSLFSNQSVKSIKILKRKMRIMRYTVWNLLQEVKLMFPGAQRMNRGNHEIAALVQACKANNVTDLVIMHETRGQPGTLVHFRLFFFFILHICDITFFDQVVKICFPVLQEPYEPKAKNIKAMTQFQTTLCKFKAGFQCAVFSYWKRD